MVVLGILVGDDAADALHIIIIVITMTYPPTGHGQREVSVIT